MKAWAGCPECSYGKRDKQVRLDDPTDTHSGVIRRCPDCGERVRLSIGGPVLPADGGVVVEKDLETPFVRKYLGDDTVAVGEPHHPWFVYVLACKWVPAHHSEEPWVHAAADAPRRYYVGSTDDLHRRLKEHELSGKREFGTDRETVHSGSRFTRAFPPVKLHEVIRVATKAEARRVEENRAGTLEQEDPLAFVWQA